MKACFTFANSVKRKYVPEAMASGTNWSQTEDIELLISNFVISDNSYHSYLLRLPLSNPFWILLAAFLKYFNVEARTYDSL